MSNAILTYIFNLDYIYKKVYLFSFSLSLSLFCSVLLSQSQIIKVLQFHFLSKLASYLLSLFFFLLNMLWLNSFNFSDLFTSRYTFSWINQSVFSIFFYNFNRRRKNYFFFNLDPNSVFNWISEYPFDPISFFLIQF